MVEMRKERVESIKFMRVVAMLLVVLIHATGVGIKELTPEDPFYFLYLFLNRFTRFEGAVFVFLSGFLLFYNYESRPYTMKTWKSFYKKRFMYILAPFLVWSLFYEMYSFYMGTRTFTGIAPLLERILTGQSNYQLYFILILVQLYFLLPVFIFLVQKLHWFKRFLPIIGVSIELIVRELFNKWDVMLPFPLFTVFIASFFFGGWIAMYYPKFKSEWSKGRLSFATLLTACAGFLYMGVYYYYHILDIKTLPYMTMGIVAVIYFLMACFILFKWSIYLEIHGSKRLNEWAEKLRIYSFGFYLLHPFLLDIAGRVFVAQTPFQFHLFIFLHYFIVIIGCYIFIRAFHLLFPKAWMVFGRLPSAK